MSHKEFFNNGYGVSIICNDFSYGLELAVLKGNKEKHSLCYDTPITDDVIGHLDIESLNETINKVKKLPPTKGDK